MLKGMKPQEYSLYQCRWLVYMFQVKIYSENCQVNANYK